MHEVFVEGGLIRKLRIPGCAGPDAAITEGIAHIVEAAGSALRAVRTKALGGYAG